MWGGPHSNYLSIQKFFYKIFYNFLFVKTNIMCILVD